MNLCIRGVQFYDVTKGHFLGGHNNIGRECNDFGVGLSASHDEGKGNKGKSGDQHVLYSEHSRIDEK